MDEKKEKKFISERIIGRELTFRRAFKYLVLSLLCGIVFGGAFFAVNYLAEKKLTESEEQTGEAAGISAEPETREEILQEETTLRKTEAGITNPEEAEKMQGAEEIQETEREETPEESPALADSDEEIPEKKGDENETAASGEGKAEENESLTAEDENKEQEPEVSEKTGFSFAQQEEIRELLEEKQKTYEAEPSDLGKLLMTQTEACREIEKYLVKVVCTISGITWFESTVETKRQSSGVIVGVTDSEILVLTVKKAVTDSGTYQVVFHDGTQQPAVIKQAEAKNGWVMFAVSKEGLGTEFAETLEAVEMMPLSKVVPGVPVISAGSPMGAASSYGFGYLNYVGRIESIVDGSICYCFTEAASSPEDGTFLMSQSGELIGLAAAQEEESEIGGNRFVIADSCSSTIESMKKGYDQAKLGITGMDISFEMKYKNIPEGMYVTNVEEGSPAFQAGLKRGDIIVMIGSREIRGLSDYCSFMRNLRPEETVKMTIKREALHSEYKELELKLTAGTR